MGYKSKELLLINLFNQSGNESITLDYTPELGKYVGKSVDIAYNNAVYIGYYVVLMDTKDHECKFTYS